jgi:hypothetical protein
MSSMLRRIILKMLKRRLMWENLKIPLKESFMYHKTIDFIKGAWFLIFIKIVDKRVITN